MKHTLRLTLITAGVMAAALSAVPVQAQTQMTPTLSTPRAATPAASRGKTVDSVVAVVNEDVITRRELDDRIRFAESQLRAQRVALPSADQLSKQVLERMILDRVQMQQAREYGIRVTDVEVDRAMQRLAEQNRLSLQEFQQRVRSEGTTVERLREDIRTEIMYSRLREREVESRIVISEGEVDNYIAEQVGLAANTQELGLAQILVRVPEGSTPEVLERARRKAQDLLRQARGGADFAQLAASNSDGQEALRGGDLGFRTPDRWPQLFVDATQKLENNQVSEVVQSANGFHILKVTGKRAAGATAAAPVRVEQTRARHILLRPNDVVSTAEVQRRLRELRDRIASGVPFTDMARQYSVDGSAAQGGDLGWLNEGDTVPEFERVMTSTKPNEISQPFESTYGWHILQVTERRMQDVSVERQRSAARNAIRDRKSEEAWVDYLRQQRDRAFVEIRLESARDS